MRRGSATGSAPERTSRRRRYRHSVTTKLERAAGRLHAFAAAFPEATEDHPWGELVFKVNKKVFVFFGTSDAQALVFTVKLPESVAFALTFDFTEPAGYGLGRSGWVSGSVSASDAPLDVIEDWIEESYRAVAPKRLVKVLDGLTP